MVNVLYKTFWLRNIDMFSTTYPMEIWFEQKTFVIVFINLYHYTLNLCSKIFFIFITAAHSLQQLYREFLLKCYHHRNFRPLMVLTSVVSWNLATKFNEKVKLSSECPTVTSATRSHGNICAAVKYLSIPIASLFASYAKNII